MLVFVAVSIFLCISYLLYCELKSLEDKFISVFVLSIMWLWFRFELPLEQLKVGAFHIAFGDFSLGMLTITAIYSFAKEIWIETVCLRKKIRKWLNPIYAIAKDIYHDHLFIFTLIALMIIYLAIMIQALIK